MGLQAHLSARNRSSTGVIRVHAASSDNIRAPFFHRICKEKLELSHLGSLTARDSDTLCKPRTLLPDRTEPVKSSRLMEILKSESIPGSSHGVIGVFRMASYRKSLHKGLREEVRSWKSFHDVLYAQKEKKKHQPRIFGWGPGDAPPTWAACSCEEASSMPALCVAPVIMTQII